MAEDQTPGADEARDTGTGAGPGAGDATPSTGDANAAAGDAADPVEARLAAAEAEVQSLKDQVLRAQAEMENVRRRAQRDVENAHKFALEKFCAELLPVADSLEKAVEVIRNSEGADRESIAEGVALSLKMFLGVLNRFGVEQVDPLGAPFDPQRHEAMALVPNRDAEPNSVMDVMQKGYMLNGRLVRAAKVVVTKAVD
jgi:molecular chaperone GrpE